MPNADIGQKAIVYIKSKDDTYMSANTDNGIEFVTGSPTLPN